MKFNKPSKGVDTTVNYEGEIAYALSPEMELYTLVVTSALGGKFYEKADKRIARLRGLLPKCRHEFVAQLAVYARQKMYLRSIPLVLAVELARFHKEDDLIRRMVRGVVQRADEITELLAYYQLANQRGEAKKLNKLSKQLQRGLADAFNRFDGYQLAKYNRKAEVTLKDALFLAHPKAKDTEQQAIFDRLVKDELTAPYTWEVELSALGQKSFENERAKQLAFKAKWEELIDSGKLGYMALLRNLRNLLECGVSLEHLHKVVLRLADREEVVRSKQLPFRFLSAYRELKGVVSGHAVMVLDALEQAIRASAENITGFGYETAVTIACDVSGSMQSPVSPKSKVQNFDIGLVLGMLLKSRCKNVISGMFGDSWKVITLSAKSILANADEMHRREGEVGYSTNGYLVVRDLLNRKLVMDKVFIFTDCQMWDSHECGDHFQSAWGDYKKMAPHAKLYLFDLAGYGNTPISINRNDVFLIAGWSDKIFDILSAIENGSNAIKEIEGIAL